MNTIIRFTLRTQKGLIDFLYLTYDKWKESCVLEEFVDWNPRLMV